MFNSFKIASSTFREICEDAPCCGCCGHDRYDSEYEPDYEDRDSFDSPEEPEEEYEEGGEDSYLDASWEDRFDMGDY